MLPAALCGAGSRPPASPDALSGEAVKLLAVLPLTNASNDPELEPLADGLTESIIGSLRKLPQLRVLARNTVFRYKGQAVDAREAGDEPGVCAVLMGRVLISPDETLVIRVELIDVKDGRHYSTRAAATQPNCRRGRAHQCAAAPAILFHSRLPCDGVVRLSG